jgi:MYXO-CTERM domain-containing protein
MGEFDGYAVVSAIEGDADLTGDGLAIAETDAGPFVDLIAPNNPVDNFFGSQINDPDGQLDTSGTYGDLNHDAALGINTSGGRQGWDITRVPLSSQDGQLLNSQTEAVLRTQTSGDSFVPTTAAFAIRVNSPDFSGESTSVGAAPDALALEEVSTVTIDMNNVGLVDADGIVLTASLPNGLELDAFTIDGAAGDVDGNAVATADLANGVAIGTVGAGATVTIEMQVRADAPPDDEDLGWPIQPQWSYEYVSCAGQDPLVEPYVGDLVVIEYVPAPDTTGGADTTDGGAETAADTTEDADSASASAEDADASATDTDGDDDDDDDADGEDSSGSASAGVGEDDSGCGCTTEPRKNGALAGLVLLALMGRRRRRT